MWALRRSSVCSSGLAHNVNIELEGNILGREAGIVAACLVIQLAVHGEGAGRRRARGAQLGLHDKRLGVDVQLLAGRKGESGVLAGGILDSAYRDVGRGIEFQSCGDEKFRMRRVGVDVESPDYEIGRAHV